MPDWAESVAKSASSMAALRDIEKRVTKERNDATAQMHGLVEKVTHALTVELLECVIYTEIEVSRS